MGPHHLGLRSVWWSLNLNPPLPRLGTLDTMPNFGTRKIRLTFGSYPGHNPDPGYDIIEITGSAIGSALPLWEVCTRPSTFLVLYTPCSTHPAVLTRRKRTAVVTTTIRRPFDGSTAYQRSSRAH